MGPLHFENQTSIMTNECKLVIRYSTLSSITVHPNKNTKITVPGPIPCYGAAVQHHNFEGDRPLASTTMQPSMPPGTHIVEGL